MSTSSPRSLTARLQRPDYVELVFGIVFVWGTGDLLSTFAALHFTGLWAEANPLVRTLLAHDPLLVVALKGAVMLVVGLVLFRYQDAVEQLPQWRVLLGGLLGVGSGVVAINLYVAVSAAAV
ncbi:DUF5658 family protein [Haloarcula salinisoli]|uniref:DUF5658 family protein n=1 Tax=Haloarcula salinisoli TaxID=2487746 RepID=A0A8J7Y9V4_9EURY|nr:DUF5658 family protein [Halomicroarcula salinisoli]MBX0286397.1 DUF5658 family protein [Halomicroarcula salinisoli]MBX0302115.1 DUF5658 family protein [Halomicroarcula salinisoli]